MLEEKLERSVEQSAAALTAMADNFFDHPDVGRQESADCRHMRGWRANDPRGSFRKGGRRFP